MFANKIRCNYLSALLAILWFIFRVVSVVNVNPSNYFPHRTLFDLYIICVVLCFLCPFAGEHPAAMQHNSADKKHIHQSVIMLAMATIMASASSDTPAARVATAIASTTAAATLATARTVATATATASAPVEAIATTVVSLMTVLAQFWKNAIYIRWLNGAVR